MSLKSGIVICFGLVSGLIQSVYAQSIDFDAHAKLNNSFSNPVVASSQVPALLETNYRYNTSPYAQNNLVTAYDGNTGIWWQYFVFWNHHRQAAITRRNFSANGEWESPVNIHHAIGGDELEYDSHNTIAIGVDQQGYLHISGNHHSDQLNYTRSLYPHSLAGFTNIPSMIPGQSGTSENRVTYPTFINAANGDLLFLYRNQTVSSGSVFSTYINRWSIDKQSWERISSLASGPRLRFYTQRVAVNHNAGSTYGRIHVMAMWRDDSGSGSGTQNNEDLFHLYSDDHGVNWKQYGGRVLDLPLGMGEPNLILDTKPHPQSRYMVNQSGLEVDAFGRPHALVTMSLVNGQKNNRYHHIWFDGSKWQVQPLDKIKPGNRSSIVSLASGEIFGMFQTGEGTSSSFKLLNLTPGSSRYDSEVITISSGFSDKGSSPNYDPGALYFHRKLSYLAARSPLQPESGNSNYLQDATVVTIDLNQLQSLRDYSSLSAGLVSVDSASLVGDRSVSASNSTTLVAAPAKRSGSEGYRMPSYARITLTSKSVGGASGTATIRFATGNGISTAGSLNLQGSSTSTSKTAILPLLNYSAGQVELSVSNNNGKGHLHIQSARIETFQTRLAQFPIHAVSEDEQDHSEEEAVICVDDDGDGWGWTGEASCVVGESVTVNSGCIDEDGDGWGWTGEASCVAGEPVTGDGECIDSDGDGWGWNGTESCLVNP